MIRAFVMALSVALISGCQTTQEDVCAGHRDPLTGVCKASSNADVADGWVKTEKGWVFKKN